MLSKKLNALYANLSYISKIDNNTEHFHDIIKFSRK